MLYDTVRWIYRSFLSTTPLAQRAARRTMALTPGRDDFQLVGLSDHLARSGAARHLLVPESAGFPAPIFWSTVCDAQVLGGSNLIFAGRKAIHHDLYDPGESLLHEAITERMTMDPERGRLTARFRLAPTQQLDRAIVCTDSGHFNYAHWLTETLSKLAIIADTPALHGVPVLVDATSHASQAEAVALVVGATNPIVRLDLGSVAAVGELITVSPTGYASMHKRFSGRALTRRSEGVFSPVALRSLRARLFAAIDGVEPESGQRLFVRRRAYARDLVNQAALEAMAVAHGFAVIEPGSEPFAEQVRRFGSASVVVGAAGAAFANLLFCPPGARVVLLTSAHKDNSNIYFPSIGAAVGVDVTWVAGHSINPVDPGLHDDYQVDAGLVERALLALR